MSPPPPPPRLRCLCLHGSRQDAEIFRQRVDKLARRLEPEAELCFVDAPHTLPLEEGQQVAMRAWWRWDPAPEEGAAAAAQAAGRVVDDWRESVAALRHAWREHGPFDGVVGFSNGAAAALLLAASSHAAPFSSLKFAIIASGYIPEPFQELIAIAGGGAERPPGAIPLPSLHLIGAADHLVPPAASRLAARLVERPRLHEHALGHAVPQKAADLEVILEFVQAQREGAAGDAAGGANGGGGGGGLSAEAAEELEALEAIFMDDYVLSSAWPCVFSVALGGAGGGGDGAPASSAALFRLVFRLGAAYPAEAPGVEVVGPLPGRDPRRAALAGVIAAAVERCAQQPMVYMLVEQVREWIDAHIPADIAEGRGGGGADGGEAGAVEAADEAAGGAREELAGKVPAWVLEEEVDMGKVAAASLLAADYAADSGSGSSAHAPPQQDGVAVTYGDSSRGRWDYTIGLVGKPSAGKSTFFNAGTDPRNEQAAARVAAFPFTTITPNTGTGYFATPCPCTRVGIPAVRCQAAGGHVAPLPATGAECAHSTVAAPGFSEALPAGSIPWRHAKITLKDVAGLVPGAYQGRGRGNAFLNDLCGADVLMHIVDVSGSTDSEGCATAAGEGSDPADEICWLRHELHCWVFSNLRQKWATVLRRPERLPSLLSGYHASKGMLEAVLSKCGVDARRPESLASVKHWDEAQVHSLVAHFLRTRFPILLVLNKADVGGAEARVAAVRASHSREPSVAVSAESEAWLCRARAKAQVQYVSGAPTCRLLCQDQAVVARLRQIEANVLHKFGSTGVQAALSAAVSLRPPALAFPVASLDSCAALPVRAQTSPLVSGHDGGGQQSSGKDAPGGVGGQPVLRDCVLLKPGSTVGELYETLKKPPYCLLAGEYVRAEARMEGGRRHVVRKDDPISPSASVLQIMCNRKKGLPPLARTAARPTTTAMCRATSSS
eukprot:jgi/Tetstr1/454340/TSEL_004018.t1